MPILIRNATADELLTTSGSSGGTALVSRARVQLRSSPELVINVYRSRSVFSFQTMTYQVHVSSLRLTSNYNEKACNCESIATQRPPDIAPAVLAYYQHFLGFLGFFVRKDFFARFGKFYLATRHVLMELRIIIHTSRAYITPDHAYLSTR